MIGYGKRGYKVEYYSSMFDSNPVILNINKWKINSFISGKIDKSELEGNKISLSKLKVNSKKSYGEK